MLEDLCRELHNWFEREVITGTFTVTDGVLTGDGVDLADHLQENQWFRVVGSVFNDGVYQYPASDLTDEAAFDGAIWAMAVPSPVIALAAEIQAWQEKYGAVDGPALSPYTSESFGGYSYTKSGGDASGSASGVTWRDVFRSRLNQWRKI